MGRAPLATGSGGPSLLFRRIIGTGRGPCNRRRRGSGPIRSRRKAKVARIRTRRGTTGGGSDRRHRARHHPARPRSPGSRDHPIRRGIRARRSDRRYPGGRRHSHRRGGIVRPGVSRGLRSRRGTKSRAPGRMTRSLAHRTGRGGPLARNTPSRCP